MTRDEEWNALLAAANRGDSRAYEQFLISITPVIRGIVRARSMGIGADLCEDILQEVLLAVHLKRHTWREGENVAPWLYAISRHKVIDAFRKRGRRVHLPIEDFADILPAPDASDPLERHDIETMLGHLEPRVAQVVRAIGIEGETISQTSKRFSLSEVGVRVILHRGLKRLAELRRRYVE